MQYCNFPSLIPARLSEFVRLGISIPRSLSTTTKQPSRIVHNINSWKTKKTFFFLLRHRLEHEAGLYARSGPEFGINLNHIDARIPWNFSWSKLSWEESLAINLWLVREKQFRSAKLKECRATGGMRLPLDYWFSPPPAAHCCAEVSGKSRRKEEDGKTMRQTVVCTFPPLLTPRPDSERISTRAGNEIISRESIKPGECF